MQVSLVWAPQKPVGDSDGASVGAEMDGDCVGNMVGDSDGSAVVGDAVGDNVGSEVVGTIVGSAEVGARDGACVMLGSWQMEALVVPLSEPLFPSDPLSTLLK